MAIDYASFLIPASDGCVWWRFEDAIKLGAGYVLFFDDDRNLVPILQAPNNRVRANERTLIGAFHDTRATIPKPPVLKREDGNFVEARAFLGWLSQYLAESQTTAGFPDELAQALKNSGTTVARSPPELTFASLTAALEDWFDLPMRDLPDAVSQRIARDFASMPWDNLSADQRRSVANQLDYQRDPAHDRERQYWLHFFERKGELASQISQWEMVGTPTAAELSQKESRLAELRKELALMKREQRRARGDFPNRKEISHEADAFPATGEYRGRYIAYPNAMTQLSQRLNATSEEVAAWVWAGPTDGGLAAYLNANELDPPPRFYYDFGNGNDFDYLSPLMACWFREDDIATFLPSERYITGMALLERWRAQPGIQEEAFIRAKITESRLLDIHPMTSGTQGSSPGDLSYPPLAEALFAVSQVERIEAEDFLDGDERSDPPVGACRSVNAAEIRLHFRVLADADENEKWWKTRMRDAERYGLVGCRVGEGKKGRDGGSLWRPDLIAGWLVDRHKKNRKGLDQRGARSALKKIPGCEDFADDLFPPEE